MAVWFDLPFVMILQYGSSWSRLRTTFVSNSNIYICIHIHICNYTYLHLYICNIMLSEPKEDPGGQKNATALVHLVR